MKSLQNLEDHFCQVLSSIDVNKRQRAGVLLPAIPARQKWADFTDVIKSEWLSWSKELNLFPHCLVVLYASLAFYKYSKREFWPHFAESVGIETPTPNIQKEINTAFVNAAQQLNLKIIPNDYVGSAVYQIGIPHSLWGGFLSICEWAVYQDNWKSLSDEEWRNAITSLIVGQKRLSLFLLDNREMASQIIQEMLDLNNWHENENIPVSDLKNACIYCTKYIDEFPETEDFLRQKEAGKYFDYINLFWDDSHKTILLGLPAVSEDKLPAKWCAANLPKKEASSSPGLEFDLGTAIFQKKIELRLEYGGFVEKYILRGLMPFGIFDLGNGGRSLNLDRDILPLKIYVFISREPLEILSMSGFNDEDIPLNERNILSDQSCIYLTYLHPIRKHAEFSFKLNGETRKYKFKTRKKIMPMFFYGHGFKSAYFSRVDHSIRCEDLPLFAVAVPHGYLLNNETERAIDKFEVRINEEKGYGHWETIYSDNDYEYYCWDWYKKPVMKITSGTFNTFRGIGKAVNFQIPKGKLNIHIIGKNVGFNYEVEVDRKGKCIGLDQCWNALPGDYGLWFLLCQSPDGMDYENLILAKSVIEPDIKVNFKLLKKYENQRLLSRKGKKWVIEESRAVFEKATDGEFLLKFCGDPSKIWQLYRYMSTKIPLGSKLPIIEVISKKKELPCLQMKWHNYNNRDVEDKL